MEISYIDFNSVLKAILDNALLLLYLCHSLNQSDTKLKPIIWLLVFSLTVGSVVVFTLSSHCLLKILSFLFDWLLWLLWFLGLQHSIKKHSTIDNLHLKLCPSEGELGKCWLLMQAFIVNVNLGVTTLFVLIAMYLCLYDNQCLVYRKLFNNVKLYLQD